MPPSSNITTRNSTGRQVWAVSKYGYRSRPSFAPSELPVPTSFRAAYVSRSEGELTSVDATIKAWRRRIYELIRETLAVERLRQLDDVQETDVPRNLVEANSPILQWMREPRLKNAAAARDEVIAEFSGDAGRLASEILRLRTAIGQAPGFRP
jgi:hypothetical protein